MYYKHHPHYGAFVVRHKTRLPSQPKTTLRELTIRVFDQKLKKRRLGVYHLTNVARLADSEFTADTEFTEEWEGSTLCGDFVNMCQSRDKKLLKKLDQTNDSFWSRALDQAALCTEPKYRPSYAVDVEASLFTPDSKNPWWVERVYFCKDFGFRLLNFMSNCSVSRALFQGKKSGFRGSCTGFHVEDHNFESVNYNHTGAPKHWIV